MSDDKGLKFWKIFLSDLYRNAEKKRKNMSYQVGCTAKENTVTRVVIEISISSIALL